MTVAVKTETSRGGAWLRVILDAGTGNILTADIVSRLQAAFASSFDLPHVRLISLESAAGDFSFGSSIQEHAPEVVARVLPAFHRFLLYLFTLPAPTAAIVRGRCLGGGFEMALACDLIFAGETASFGLPEIALGVFPPAAAVLLPLRIGAFRATSAVLTGEPRSARAWASAGLIELLAPDDQLEQRVTQWFETHLGGKSAIALQYAAWAARLVVRDRAERLLAESERLYLDELMRTGDAAEGVAAFLEKRPPSWRDE
jgi:cyclohexa-1,5-dienecarbonyl-CoA hydratase